MLINLQKKLKERRLECILCKDCTVTVLSSTNSLMGIPALFNYKVSALVERCIPKTLILWFIITTMLIIMFQQ